MNKIIFISNSLADIQKVKDFAKNSKYSMEHYSKEEWKNKSVKKTFSNKSTRNINSINSSNLSVIELPSSGNSLLQTMDEIKVEAIKKALLQSRGNASKAAEALKIGRATLYRKIKELGVDLKSIRQSSEEDKYAAPTTFQKTA